MLDGVANALQLGRELPVGVAMPRAFCAEAGGQEGQAQTEIGGPMLLCRRELEVRSASKDRE
jgi:hypothetical protein